MEDTPFTCKIVVQDGERTFTVERTPEHQAEERCGSATVRLGTQEYPAYVWNFSLVNGHVRVYLETPQDFDQQHTALFISKNGKVAVAGGWHPRRRLPAITLEEIFPQGGQPPGRLVYATAPHQLEYTRIIRIVSFELCVEGG